LQPLTTRSQSLTNDTQIHKPIVNDCCLLVKLNKVQIKFFGLIVEGCKQRLVVSKTVVLLCKSIAVVAKTRLYGRKTLREFGILMTIAYIRKACPYSVPTVGAKRAGHSNSLC